MEKPHAFYRVLVLAILLLNFGCMPDKVFGQQEDAKALISNQFEKWQKGEASFFDLLDDNVVWEVSGRSPVSGIYNGKEDFLNRAVAPVINQLSTRIVPELISISSDEKYVWLHWKGKATAKTGNSYENQYLWKMVVDDGKIKSAVAFLDTYELNLLMNNKENTMNRTIEETKEYIGIWVTEDGNIRHELLPDFRYDEARGSKKSAYQGSYTISGNHIDYKDDTGFTADGEFKNGILYHGGMILYKKEQ